MPEIGSRLRARPQASCTACCAGVVVLSLAMFALAGCSGTRETVGEGPDSEESAEAPQDPDEEVATRDTTRLPVPRYVPRAVAPDERSEAADQDPEAASLGGMLPDVSESFRSRFQLDSPEWFLGIGRGFVRLSGCDGALVSPEGLVVTSRSCLSLVLGPAHALLQDAFLADTRQSEGRIDELTAAVVTDVLDLTAAARERVRGGVSVDDALAALRDSLTDARPLRAVVTYANSDSSFAGIAYDLHQDVRLVFLPHPELAEFGGDFDAGSFPQYKMDVAFLRLYDGGAAAQTPEHYTWLTDTAAQDARLFLLGSAPASTLDRRALGDATLQPLWVAGGTLQPIPTFGTSIPERASFYGLYDRYHSFDGRAPWSLPQTWADPPSDFPFWMPASIAPTNPRIEGTLGGPLLDERRRVWGVVYDDNEEMVTFPLGEVRAPRAVAVSSVGLTEVLRRIYQAEALVFELEAGANAGD